MKGLLQNYNEFNDRCIIYRPIPLLMISSIFGVSENFRTKIFLGPMFHFFDYPFLFQNRNSGQMSFVDNAMKQTVDFSS